MGWITNIIKVCCVGFGLIAIIMYPEETLSITMKLFGFLLDLLKWAVTDGIDFGMRMLEKIVTVVGRIIAMIDGNIG